MAKTKKRPKKKASKRPAASAGGKSGKWVFDPESGKLVKISDRIPSVASKAGKSSGGDLSCASGACASCPHKHGH